MGSKLLPLSEAVSRFVGDSSTIFVGGFGQCVPFAIAHEIVRQRKRNLTLCRSGADILFDLLIGAGCVRRVIFGYVGNPGIGLAHAFRRAVEAGEIEVEDWTNFSLVLRLHAASLGVPYLPTASLVPGDLPAHIRVAPVVCPFTGEQLAAVPALAPDVAIIHAHRADEAGNVQLFGLPGDTIDGANASKNVIATVEEIVDTETIRSAPERTIVPSFRVDAVSLVPFGAYPSYVDGHYGRDDEAYAEWDVISRSAERLSAWIERNVLRHSDFAAYVESIDATRREALVAQMKDARHGR